MKSETTNDLHSNHRQVVEFRRRLSKWGKTERRRFSWRGAGVDPYVVFVTEILLTRTTARKVGEVIPDLLTRFPDLSKLSAADEHELAGLLRPLGLHRKRANMLIKAARTLTVARDPKVPDNLDDLLSLPYVGRYGANAIRCFAFGRRSAIVDANVVRVLTRVFSFPDPGPRLYLADPIWAFATSLLPRKNVREYNWALLDLGGMICRPRKPKCEECPLAEICDAHTEGNCGCGSQNR